MRQRTIAEKISCTGVGLHSGAPAELRLIPARADSGVTFVRTDRRDPVEVPASLAFVTSTRNATTLGRDGDEIGTVEHLLAALYALGVDNVRVEVDGPEIPVLDGCASSFAFLIRSAGIFSQQATRSVLRVRRAIEIRDGERWIRVEPAPSLQIAYVLDFDHPLIGRQAREFPEIDAEIFEREIAPARTFGILRDVNALRRAGLARGGSLDNAVVLGATRVLNPGGLRWPDEFVRHKILDLLGDLALLGARIEGRVRVVRGGHVLHHRLAAAIAAQIRRPALPARSRAWPSPPRW